MIGDVPLDKIRMDKEKRELIKRLLKAKPLNMGQIYENLNLEGENRVKRRFFNTANPYLPRFKERYAYLPPVLKYPLPSNPENFEINKILKFIRYYGQEPVVAFMAKKSKGVCGVRFVDNERINYLLKSFKNEEEAISFGYMVTHGSHCGMCSTLKDLAVYMARPNLTTPARKCSRNLIPNKIKKCYKTTIGFTNNCSEVWAYSSENTRKHCMNACLETYGLLNILSGKMDSIPNIDEEGNLNSCIACDENKSGPGFKYGVGRNRRNSGITSAIERDESEMIRIDHFKYFR